jgi:hypothetical protein
MRRSSHIAIRVAPERVEEAVSHYKAALGVIEKSRNEQGVELRGPDFTLWIDRAEQTPLVLQEFVAEGGDSVKDRLQSLGCVVFDEGKDGFHVRDPFGMNYHVWIESPANPAV